MALPAGLTNIPTSSNRLTRTRLDSTVFSAHRSAGAPHCSTPSPRRDVPLGGVRYHAPAGDTAYRSRIRLPVQGFKQRGGAVSSADHDFRYTLRDGEQEPGIARARRKASREQLDASCRRGSMRASRSSQATSRGVQAVARVVERTTVASLCRTRRGHRRSDEASPTRSAPSPRLPRHEQDPH